MQGIEEGFHIVKPELVNVPVECKNYRSATDPMVKDKIEAQIKHELQHGHYRVTNEKPTIVSALGAIPKKNSDKVRLIHDCSRPCGQAVNDFADPNKFQYQTIQDAVDLITPGCYLAKLDLASAYRSVKIHPSNYKATGLQWQFAGDNSPTYMVDCRLPFGAAASPEIFNELSQAVCRIMADRGSPGIVCYLDDYLVVSESFQKCLSTLNELMSVLRFLGFSISYDKVEGPSQCLTFLGIQLDTVHMTLSLSDNRLRELRSELSLFSNLEKVSKRQLQSLAGKLNWATQCIYGGRCYLRRIIDRINSLRYAWHRTRLTKGIREDISWWLHFMDRFNGSVLMVDSRPAAALSIDACSMGAGAFYLGDWVYTRWRPAVASGVHINTKEIMALEPAVLRWAPLWANKTVYVHSDNVTAVAAFNKMSCKDPIGMAAIRRIFWMSVAFNFRLKAKYYPGCYNTLADAVSRAEMPGGWQRLYDLLNSCSYVL